MTTRQPTSLLEFFRQYMLAPVLAQRSALIIVAVSLAVLSLTQAMFLVLIKGFLAAFFADTTSLTLSLNGILPEAIIPWLSGMFDLSVRRADVIVYVPIGILCAGFLKASASYFYNLGLVRLSLRVAQHYREKVFQAVLSLPWLNSSRRSAGEWMSVIMADSVFIQSRLNDFSTAFVKDGVLIISCLFTLAFIHWPAALVLLLLAPIIGWKMGRAGKRISWFTQAFQNELGLLSGQLLGIRERFRFMRAQHGEAFERYHFKMRNSAYLDMMNGSIFLRAIVAPGMEWIGFLIFASFIYAWTRKIPGFAVGPEVAIQFFVALGLILKPVREMGEQISRWGETVGGLRRSMEIINEVSSGKPSILKENDQIVRSSSRPDLPSSIRIDHLEVRYQEKTAVSADSLALEMGKSIAIIGPSGSGKSTILKSFAGLIEPAKWQSNVDWLSFADHTALVSQQPFLFKDSIFKNLTYGLSPIQLNALSSEQIYGVLKSVNLDQWLDGVPGGLNSMFNPVQTNLSGGQIQRLVIARALLRRSAILLLDEATSAVDAATEHDISVRVIRNARAEGRLLVTVTHRLRWLELFDEVWFIENGRVVFRGRHIDLLVHTRYKDFCSSGDEK